MTKNSALKKDARAYQREHPGVRLADAMAAVRRFTDTDTAAERAVPWIQRANARTTCYFCGRDSVIVSFGDLSEDHGRVEIYCENSDCDAREVEIVVIDDGTGATRNRSDGRILAHFTPDGNRPEWVGVGNGIDWAAGTVPFLRRSNSQVTCLFCGQLSCTLATDDVAADTGRLRIRCTHTGCSVQRAEAVLTRDGLLWASRRPVVKALAALFPTRADRLTEALPPGELPIFPGSDFLEPADGIDPLQMRLSGPVPWDETS
ncbi:hypothetical protein [Mycobacterium kansasii]|uniref:hypothetical protein n=1 Tax=Mycobacterium kansasii TaxID=1768 RepID=UPI0015D5089E|nr:hypothetical protein [Mycobacterium kansasii]